MMFNRGNSCDRAPTCPTVSGVEGADRRLIGVGSGHNDRPIGTDHRLAADYATIIGRGRAPGLPAIGGGAHLQTVARAVVVPLGVAVAIERAGCRVVADDPVL